MKWDAEDTAAFTGRRALPVWNGTRYNWVLQTQNEEAHLYHNNFVEGRSMRRGGMSEEAWREAEWIPDLLPAPVRLAAGFQRYRDAEQPPPRISPKVGDEINYFSDGAAKTASVTEHQDRAPSPGKEDSHQKLSREIPPSQCHSLQPKELSSVSRPLAPQTLSTSARKIMAGRGRGRGAGGGGMLKGAPWEYDASIKLESKPTDLFPAHPNLKRPAPLTAKERREINNYKTLQDQMHRGPLYTQPTKRDPNAPAKTFGEEQFNRQYGVNRKADMDPFHGVETYSMRYAPKPRDLPKLSDQPFDKSLFPKELWSTLEGEEGEEVRNHINRSIQRKAAFLSGTNGKDASEKVKLVLEKIHNVTGDDDNEELDEEMQDEEVDDEYDDDELGNDYNGEQYFDNGENDMEDDGEGGGDDY
ncbi:hypothetical protein EG329_001716 [Mollisiaceae sp. DMI_Dod_QoI]|nr:hypothetical protein EG329_001716 [Helotiales sp. DMI_Dod_QoI]